MASRSELHEEKLRAAADAYRKARDRAANSQGEVEPATNDREETPLITERMIEDQKALEAATATLVACCAARPYHSPGR
jgi:hypothetical protein